MKKMTCCRIGGNWQKTLIRTLYGHVNTHVLNSFGSICMILFTMEQQWVPSIFDVIMYITIKVKILARM